MELEIIKSNDFDDEQLEEIVDDLEGNADFSIAVRWKETPLGLYTLLAYLIKEEELTIFPEVPKIKHGNDLLDILKDLLPKIDSASKLVVQDDDDVRVLFVVDSDYELLNKKEEKLNI